MSRFSAISAVASPTAAVSRSPRTHRNRTASERRGRDACREPAGPHEAWRNQLDRLRERAAGGRVTIIYAARDREHSNAVVLVELLRDDWALDRGRSASP